MQNSDNTIRLTQDMINSNKKHLESLPCISFEDIVGGVGEIERFELYRARESFKLIENWCK